METFQLTSDPAPKTRTVEGRHQRRQCAYQFRNRAYDGIEQFMRCWKMHRPTLPPKARDTLEIPTTAAALRILRPALQRMMQVLGIKRPRVFLAMYGRIGERAWSWDHQFPLRAANAFDSEDVQACRHIRNLRPRLAARNKRRAYEPPIAHPELFQGKESQP